MADEPCTCGPRAEIGQGADECPRVDECYDNYLAQQAALRAAERLGDFR